MNNYKIRCNKCQQLNGLKRDYCYLCGKELDKNNQEFDKNIYIKRLSIFIVIIMLISIIIGSFYYILNYTLNEDEKFVLNKIESFKKNNLKYPNSTIIEEILYYKNDNINEKNIILKIKAKNSNLEYINDYIYIHTLNNKIIYIGSNYGYESLQNIFTSYNFNIDNDSTPYKNLSNLEYKDNFLGLHYMGKVAKKDILDFQEGNELETNFVKIRKNNILKNLK